MDLVGIFLRLADKLDAAMLELDGIHEKLTIIFAEGGVEGYTEKFLRSAMSGELLASWGSASFCCACCGLRQKEDIKALFKKAKRWSHAGTMETGAGKIMYACMHL